MVEDVETGKQERVECDYFFSTMPIKHLIGMMRPHPPSLVTEVAEGLCYRDFLTVGLLLKKLHVQEKGKKPAIGRSRQLDLHPGSRRARGPRADLQ